MPRMISQLDSVVVGVNDLSVAAADYAALTGSGAQKMAFRGESAVSFHMANTCLRLVETSERQGLKQLVFGCPDLDAARRRLPNVGVEIIDEASDDGFLALNPETTRTVNLALTAARDTESRDLPSAGALSGLDNAVVASGDGEIGRASCRERV